MAVACRKSWSFQERLELDGVPHAAAIAVWNFRDSIHPDFVLEAPHDITAFSINPCQPHLVAAGCHNGQVVLWDTSTELDRIDATKRAVAGEKNGEEGDDVGGGEGGGEEAVTPVVEAKLVSGVEVSHT